MKTVYIDITKNKTTNNSTCDNDTKCFCTTKIVLEDRRSFSIYCKRTHKQS